MSLTHFSPVHIDPTSNMILHRYSSYSNQVLYKSRPCPLLKSNIPRVSITDVHLVVVTLRYGLASGCIQLCKTQATEAQGVVKYMLASFYKFNKNKFKIFEQRRKKNVFSCITSNVFFFFFLGVGQILNFKHFLFPKMGRASCGEGG